MIRNKSYRWSASWRHFTTNVCRPFLMIAYYQKALKLYSFLRLSRRSVARIEESILKYQQQKRSGGHVSLSPSACGGVLRCCKRIFLIFYFKSNEKEDWKWTEAVAHTAKPEMEAKIERLVSLEDETSPSPNGNCGCNKLLLLAQYFIIPLVGRPTGGSGSFFLP